MRPIIEICGPLFSVYISCSVWTLNITLLCTCIPSTCPPPPVAPLKAAACCGSVPRSVGVHENYAPPTHRAQGRVPRVKGRARSPHLCCWKPVSSPSFLHIVHPAQARQPSGRRPPALAGAGAGLPASAQGEWLSWLGSVAGQPPSASALGPAGV